MENVDLWQRTPQILEIVYNSLLIVLPILIGLASVSASGAGLIVVSRKSLKAVRSAVDSPKDALVKRIAAETGLSEEAVSLFLLSRVDELLVLFPEKPASVTNITITEAPK